MNQLLLSWLANDSLNELIQRYYRGEAGLWNQIRDLIDMELRQRGLDFGSYHIRLQAQSDNRYQVKIQTADTYRIEP
jgi:hypothetical protein